MSFTPIFYAYRQYLNTYFSYTCRYLIHVVPTDQGYDYYTETLADAGRIPRLSGTGNPGRSNGTAYEQGMYHARQWANGGYSQSQIASKLANETGLSNDLISSIMNQIDYEWRGTK